MTRNDAGNSSGEGHFERCPLRQNFVSTQSVGHPACSIRFTAAVTSSGRFSSAYSDRANCQCSHAVVISPCDRARSPSSSRATASTPTSLSFEANCAHARNWSAASPSAPAVSSSWAFASKLAGVCPSTASSHAGRGRRRTGAATTSASAILGTAGSRTRSPLRSNSDTPAAASGAKFSLAAVTRVLSIGWILDSTATWASAGYVVKSITRPGVLTPMSFRNSASVAAASSARACRAARACPNQRPKSHNTRHNATKPPASNIVPFIDPSSLDPSSHAPVIKYAHASRVPRTRSHIPNLIYHAQSPPGINHIDRMVAL